MDKGISDTVYQALNLYNDLIENFIYLVRGIEISRTAKVPLDLLQRWRYRDATDPLDKIHALMGLFPTIPFPSVQSSSYKITPAMLYTNVTLDLIRQESCLRTLVGFRGEPHVTKNIPTWAIDFTCYSYGNRRRPWKWWNHSHRYKEFAACGNKSIGYSTLYNDTVLSLRGVLVDRIVEVGDVCTWRGYLGKPHRQQNC